MRAHGRRRALQGRLHAGALAQPLGVHAVAGAVDVAAANALMGLHQVEVLPRQALAYGAREAPVTPQAAQKWLAGTSLPNTSLRPMDGFVLGLMRAPNLVFKVFILPVSVRVFSIGMSLILLKILKMDLNGSLEKGIKKPIIDNYFRQIITFAKECKNANATAIVHFLSIHLSLFLTISTLFYEF